MTSVNEILDFAINNEQKAHDFYMRLADKVDKEYMKKLFHSFAKEEAGHKAKLLSVKNGKQVLSNNESVVDLKISDYLVDIDEKDDLDYQEALIIAMKREKAAFRLYTNLADKVDGDAKKVFQGLAIEESQHKLRFEVEYDDEILKEN